MVSELQRLEKKVIQKKKIVDVTPIAGPKGQLNTLQYNSNTLELPDNIDGSLNIRTNACEHKTLG